MTQQLTFNLMPERRAWSVSELTAKIRDLLAKNFTGITVQGEISNCREAQSGHFYFTLKDDRAQVRCVFFKQQQRGIKFRPEDGLQMTVRGSISVYEPRGEYQIYVESLEPIGLGVEEVLEAIVARIPPPKGNAENPLQALIFDSWFDIYRGAVVLVRVMEGRVANHVKIKLVAGDETYEVEQLGTLTPKPVALQELEAGDVGFIVANIKRVADARMGDTVIEVARPASALPGFEAIKPMVFAGLFPVLADDYEPLRDALGKLQLNDAAFFYEPENSVALGFGFRCGFLGLLHMEIVQERLEREFGLNLITTAPSVRYRITRVTG